MTETQCAAEFGNIWQGPGTVCAEVECPQPTTTTGSPGAYCGPCAAAGEVFFFQIPIVQNFSCEYCDFLTGTVFLVNTGVCEWLGDYYDEGCSPGTATMQYSPQFNQTVLNMTGLVTYVMEGCPSDGLNEFTLSSSTGECSGWPNSLFVDLAT